MISGTLSENDYLAAQRLHRKEYVRRQSLILAALVLIGLIAAWAGYLLAGAALFGAGAGGFIGELFCAKVLMPRKHLRIFRQQVSLRSAYTYSWDSECISVVSEAGQAKRPWRNYIKSKESDDVFLLYHSDAMFEVIPKVWFHSLEQAEEFRRMALGAGN